MYANQIENALAANNITSQHTLGVFSADEAENAWRVALFDPYQTWVSVVNTAPGQHPGQHWLLLVYRGIGRKPVFFDTYGQNVITYGEDIKKTVNIICQRSNEPEYERNEMQIQTNNSSVCGHYCLYVAFMLCKYPMCPLEWILRKFSPYDQESNDETILEWVTNNFCVTANCNNLCYQKCTARYC